MAVTVISVVAGLAALVLFFKPFFGDAGGFLDCLRLWFTPDIISAFRGEYYEDRWAHVKIAFWLFLGAGTGFGVYGALRAIFG